MFYENDITALNDIEKYKAIVVEKDLMIKDRYENLRGDLFQLLLTKGISIEKIVGVDDLRRVVNENRERVYSDEMARLSRSKSTQGFIIQLTDSKVDEVKYVTHYFDGTKNERVLKNISDESLTLEIEIKRFGLEAVVARNSIDADSYVPITSIAEVVSGRAIKSSIPNSELAGQLIGAKQLNMYPVITNNLSLPAIPEHPKRETKIEVGTVLVNSDSHTTDDFCRPSYVSETPATPTYLSSKIFAIKLKDEFENDIEYSKELFNFFLDSTNVRKQMLFPIESGRIVISINSFSTIWVPKKGLFKSDVDLDALKELSNRKSALIKEQLTIEDKISVVMNKYNSQHETGAIQMTGKMMREYRNSVVTIDELIE
jgi:hypothetical protein